jgi:hypothetical protein
MSLALNHPFRSVLEASIHRLHEEPAVGLKTRGDSWWYRINYDNGSELEGTDEAGPWTRTSMSATLSKQYRSYDETVQAMNDELAEFYRDRS